MVNRVRQGDLSFGSDEIEPTRSSVTRLAASAPARQLPPVHTTVTGQVGPAPAFSGNTQQIVMPPPPSQPQGQSWLNRIAHFGGQ